MRWKMLTVQHGKKNTTNVADKRLSRRTMTVKDVIRLVPRSAVETGTPPSNRDIVNRQPQRT